MTRSRAWSATCFTLVLVLAAAPAFAVSSSDAAKHANAATAARAKAAQQQALANQLKGQTAQLDQQVALLQSQADVLDPKIASASKRTDALRARIAQADSQIASETAQIRATQALWSQQQALLGERVTATYKQGQWYYIELLITSQDMRDFIARTELLSRLLMANSRAAGDLERTRLTLEQQKNELDRSVKDLDVQRREALAVENDLKGLQGQRQGKVDEQQSVLDQKSSLLADSRANAKRLLAVAQSEEAESARIKAELSRAKRGSGTYRGAMAWPVPGFERITSPFGWRTHPILHTRIFHAGIDISGSGINGAAIAAAGSGTIIRTGSNGGYGNVVMIDHGNGVVTIYAHQQGGGIRVSVGQHVKKGQRIGTVGSTGLSTGPHCHFEVRVNGTAVNPMTYL